MIAHVGGVPVEEFLPALAGTGTGLVVSALPKRAQKELGWPPVNA